jgi:hypothetical protein
MIKEPSSVEAVPQWGSKMSALSEKRRAFVIALYSDDAPAKGDGLLIWAAREAGYGTPTSSNKSLGVIASRIVNDEQVQHAIAEYAKGLIRAISPEAVRSVRELVRNTKHKDHARAIGMILDRVDPPETTHTVKVEGNRPPSREAVERVLARIDELAVRAGVVLPPIDADYKLIENARDDA